MQSQQQQNYKELEVWMKSKELVHAVLKGTKNFPQSEQLLLTKDLRDDSFNILANLVEACNSRDNKKSISLLSDNRKFIYSIETKLEICYDINYIDEVTFAELSSTLESCKRLTYGFIKHFKNKTLATGGSGNSREVNGNSSSY